MSFATLDKEQLHFLNIPLENWLGYGPVTNAVQKPQAGLIMAT
jgi:hypothetical protein